MRSIEWVAYRLTACMSVLVCTRIFCTLVFVCKSAAKRCYNTFQYTHKRKRQLNVWRRQLQFCIDSFSLSFYLSINMLFAWNCLPSTKILIVFHTNNNSQKRIFETECTVYKVTEQSLILVPVYTAHIHSVGNTQS